MSPETYSAFLTAFRHMAALQEEMTPKPSKTWKGRFRQSYAAAFLLEAAKAFDVLKELGRHALLRTDLSVPEEILALVELSGGAATEWQKIFRYMEDTEGNRLKMEARLHRIAAYQERGEKRRALHFFVSVQRRRCRRSHLLEGCCNGSLPFPLCRESKSRASAAAHRRGIRTAGPRIPCQRKIAPAICPFWGR